MDSLTQIVLGAAVGEAVLGKKVGNKAMLYGAIAGTIPDLDILTSFFFDPLTVIEMHRGFTHSIIFATAFAPVFGFIVSKIERRGPATFKDWSWLFFWGLFTHPLLDALTTWGTKLFWPLDYPVAVESIFVIDPLYTVPFLIFVVLAMFFKRDDRRRRILNTTGLVISTGYLILAFGIKCYATQQVTAALNEQQIAYTELKVKPSVLNTILWTTNVMADDVVYLGDYSLFDTQPIKFYPIPKNHELLGDLINDNNVKRLIKITENWYVVHSEDGKLYLNDLRFGTMNYDYVNPQFSFSYELVEKDGKTTIVENRKTPRDAGRIISYIWQRIRGN